LDKNPRQNEYFVALRRRVLRYPKWLRTMCGVALVVGGILGFLPVLGFWMIPLGIVILSYDNAKIRRFRRKFDIKLRRKWRARRK